MGKWVNRGITLCPSWQAAIFFGILAVFRLALAAPSKAQGLEQLPLPRAQEIWNSAWQPGSPASTGPTESAAPPRQSDDALPHAPQPQTQSQSQPQQPPEPQKNQRSNDRILWMMPNFLTVENAGNIPPLAPAEKFKTVARGIFDPFEFLLIGFVAGLGQASDSDHAYGQGAQGYAKRYATAYGDNAIENFMASAVFPTVLHQDPRFYQLGHGGFLKRTGHALGRVLTTRSDSGRNEINYSELAGALSAAAVSTYGYHPHNERSVGTVLSVWGTQMSYDAATFMIKEFWPDLRRKSAKNSH